MFGTTLNYVTLKLLGEGVEDGLEAMEQARKWFFDHSGATAITSWAPEIWHFPYLLPCHLDLHLTVLSYTINTMYVQFHQGTSIMYCLQFKNLTNMV